MNNKNLTIGLLVVFVIAIFGVFSPMGQSVIKSSFGGVTNYDELDAPALKVGGANGSRVGPLITGTCTLIGMDVSQVASSTSPYDCAVTGVVSGDTVMMEMGTSTTVNTLWATASGIGSGWAIISAKASSTAGFITAMVSNQTGGAKAPSASFNVASSTNYLVLHPVTTVPGL